jgi:hypothetical protein
VLDGAQHVVPVVGDAIEHPGLARAAVAFLARERDAGAHLTDRVEDRLPGGDRYGRARPGHLDLERPVAGRVRRPGGGVGGEPFTADGQRRVRLLAELPDGGDQRRGPADVDRGTRRRAVDQRGQVGPALLVGLHDRDPVRVDRAQLVGQRHRPAVPAVDGAPGFAGALEPPRHREDRRDPDASRDQQIPFGRAQGEVIMRAADGEILSD